MRKGVREYYKKMNDSKVSDLRKMDLLSFEDGDAIPSPYFTLEDELAETKKKLQRLEEQTKQRWTQMENRLSRLDETVLKLKEDNIQKDNRLKRLEKISFPYIDPNGKMQLYNLRDDSLKISNQSNKLFLWIGDKLFCELCDEKIWITVLSNLPIVHLDIELPKGSYDLDLLDNSIYHILYSIHLQRRKERRKELLDVHINCQEGNVLQMIVKTCIEYSNYIKSVTIMFPYPISCEREIDEMKAHCTAREIEFTIIDEDGEEVEFEDP